MEFNVEARKLQLENLDQFILSYKRKVENVLNTIGWNIRDTLQDNQFITCSLDTSHKVPQKAVGDHIQKCALRKEGYALDEEFLSEPQQGECSIHIDDHQKIEILSAAHKTIKDFTSGWNGQDPDPKTSNRLMSTFSTDERLALYDYAIAKSIGQAKLPDFDIFSVKSKRDDGKPLTYEEKLALERDLKRRKIKYRSIHTSHKNHTEVLREVIESQMELYRDWLNNANCTRASAAEAETSKSEYERARATAVSRNSSTSSGSRGNRRKPDEKNIQDVRESRSTSRKTSIDRESEKSMNESGNHRKRSGSRDSHHHIRKADHRERNRDRHHRHNNRERSPYDTYKRYKYKRSNSREQRRSQEKCHNGYRDRKR